MPGRLDPLSDTPLYKQIAARLRDQIENSELKPGTLCRQRAVSWSSMELREARVSRLPTYAVE
jgi:DNA-binding transcriptional MocR family regulator